MEIGMFAFAIICALTASTSFAFSHQCVAGNHATNSNPISLYWLVTIICASLSLISFSVPNGVAAGTLYWLTCIGVISLVMYLAKFIKRLASLRISPTIKNAA